MRRKIAAVLCAGTAMFLASCTATQVSEQAPEDIASVSTDGFRGAYAAEFAYNSSTAPNDQIRAILSDSDITEIEFNEVLTSFKHCVSDFGYEIRDYKFDGSYGVDFADGEDTALVNSRVNDCSKSSGEAQVGSLYSWINRNPERLDESEIVAQCLVARGTVENGFTAADYDAALMSDSFPFVDTEQGPDLLVECQVDPLGISR